MAGRHAPLASHLLLNISETAEANRNLHGNINITQPVVVT
jgi:hypothetical protein